MSVDRELWEKELGRVALRAIEEIHGGDALAPAVQTAAAGLLETIRGILDDESLNDFDCVEEIVHVLDSVGITTTRHDFG